MNPIQSDTCFYKTCELIVVLNFLNGWKNYLKFLITCEFIENSKFGIYK